MKNALEVAEALKELGIVLPGKNVPVPDGGKYLGTSDVVRRFLSGGLATASSVIVVAHRHHTYRCKKITEAVFSEQKESKSLLVADNPDEYDENSVQPWTRSFLDWVIYEVGNRFANRYRKTMPEHGYKLDDKLSCPQCFGTEINSWQESTYGHSVHYPIVLGHFQCVECGHNREVVLERELP